MEFEFPAKVEDLSKVPSQFAAMYEKSDDGFTISQDPKVKGAVEAIFGFSKAIKAVRAESDELRKKKVDLTSLKEYGEDPVSISASVKTRIENLQAELAKTTKADAEALRKDLMAHHQKEKDGILQKQERLKGQLYTVFVENAARQAISDQKGDPNLLMPFVKERIKVIDNEDGSMGIFIVDESGNRRYNSASHDMTISELVLEMKTSKTFIRLFDSESPRGGGMPPSGAKGTPRPDGSALTAQQMISKGLESRRPR